jgi:Aldehyde dehydrogenase family
VIPRDPGRALGGTDHVRAAAVGSGRGDRGTESRIAGKPIRLASEFDVPGTIDNVAFFAGAARNLEGKASAEYSADHTSSIRREPVGVVGSISPWNYPLQNGRVEDPAGSRAATPSCSSRRSSRR